VLEITKIQKKDKFGKAKNRKRRPKTKIKSGVGGTPKFGQESDGLHGTGKGRDLTARGMVMCGRTSGKKRGGREMKKK